MKLSDSLLYYQTFLVHLVHFYFFIFLECSHFSSAATESLGVTYASVRFQEIY